jgi:Ca-activated chloride channel family protein
MTDDEPTIELSRRKVLGGLGGIGVASAGAALGTSAYFSDEESFDGNSLTAGELDLLLDYQVTYHGGPGRLEDVQDMGYPNAEPIEDEEGTYLLEEVPNSSDTQGWDEYVTEEEFCQNREAMINGDEVQPIRIEDVKPGDSGCLNTSLHLCDNPAYIWMNGELVADDDNGLTEPESEVDDSGGEGEGELAENLDTRVWYDENCDCEVREEGSASQADVMLVLDRSGSMSGSMGDLRTAATGLVDELGPSANVGLVSYADDDTLDQELTANHADVNAEINALTSGGSTNIEGGVLTAQDELETGTNARSGADKIMVVMSDGQANVDDDQSSDSNDDPTEEANAAKTAGTEIFTVGFGSLDTTTLEAMASDPANAHFFPATDAQALIDAFANIGQTIAGERVIFEGTLAELTDVLSSGDGIPLDGDRQTDFDEVDEGEPAAGDGEGRECFMPSETHCIGLEWELPVDVGNEVQTDGVVFDVGFYAEQCRHNDGTGSVPASNGTGGNSTDGNVT